VLPVSWRLKRCTNAPHGWQSLNEIEAQFRVDNDFADADASYFHDILHGVPASLTEIDTALAPCLDLTIEELDPVELACCACPPGNCSSASTCRTAS
jgi:transcription termination factor NusB